MNALHAQSYSGICNLSLVPSKHIMNALSQIIMASDNTCTLLKLHIHTHTPFARILKP